MKLPQRKPTRLDGFDYSAPGAYFVTICTKDKKCLLGEIVGDDWASSPTINVETIIRSFKTLVTKETGGKIFQRSFHDHIIRGEEDYIKIAEYIDINPLKWELDCFYEKTRQ